MPSFATQPMRFDPAGEAKSREQKRLAHLENEERNTKIPVFMFQGYGFRPQNTVRGSLNFEGPLCPRKIEKDRMCFSLLKGAEDGVSINCEVCGFSNTLPQPLQRFREIARLAYEGFQRFTQSGGSIQTLDTPYEAIKAEDEDETRRIRIKWSQKDGRNQAVIYFIDKEGNTEGAKVHGFVDMDREEFRHDAGDVSPGKVVAVVTASFPHTDVEIKYKKENKENGQ